MLGGFFSKNVIKLSLLLAYPFGTPGIAYRTSVTDLPQGGGPELFAT